MFACIAYVINKMSCKIRYKLTTQDMRSNIINQDGQVIEDELTASTNGYLWELNKWQEPIGNNPSLCCDGWLHCYSNPLLAVLFNPIHSNIKKPRLFKCEVKGDHLDDHGVKEGWKHMRLVEEISLPEISLIQKVAFGILCALEVYRETKFVIWAEAWLSGKDRTLESAIAAIHAVNNIVVNTDENSAEYSASFMFISNAAEYSANAAARAAENSTVYASEHVAFAAANAREYINLVYIANQAMKVK